MPTNSPKKTKTKPQSPQDELRDNLNKAYPTLIGGMADRLTEKDALDVAIPVLQDIWKGLQTRLEELQDEE